MSIKYITADSVPSSPILSQGIAAGQFVFTSGQIGVKGTDGQLEDMTFEDEVVQSLENIRSILKSEMLDLEDIVKITIYITDINYYDALNNIYLKYFPKHKPARTCLVVSSLAKGARVEIGAIAFNKNMQ